MAEVFLAIVEAATGRVVSQWHGDDANGVTVAKPGFIAVDCLPHLPGPFTKKRWTGISFVPKIVRDISWQDFMNRWTVAEQDGLEQLAESQPRLRSWIARMVRNQEVKLDDQEILNVLGFIKAQGVPTIWPDNTTADGRITDFRVDGKA